MRLLGLVYLPNNPHRHRADMHVLLTEMKCCACIGLHVLVGPFVQRVSSTHFMESFYSQFSAKVYSAWRGTWCPFINCVRPWTIKIALCCSTPTPVYRWELTLIMTDHQNCRAWNLQDMNLQDIKNARHEIAGHEDAEHEIAGQKM